MDWKRPPYAAIFRERLANLERIRKHPERIPQLKAHYRDNPADFICDWGVTWDPRNAERGLPSLVPFSLFPKQREWVEFIVAKWKAQRPGATEKARDIGISWLATSLACTLCLHHEGLAIGFGSRVVDLVDKIGTMKPLLPKARMFMEHLPEEFRGGWLSWRDAPYMRMNFPEAGSIIMGEGGDQIGRGDRASIYFVDEAEYLERPDLIERSLSQTTNCRIDMSSVNGSANPIAQKILTGKVEVFRFDWRDDPRKDDAWYEKMCEDHDPVTVAQEIDRDRSASVTGTVIPGAWARSCLGALKKLGLVPSGAKVGALDVADEGTDKNAWASGVGVEVDRLEEWSGKGEDVFATTERAFGLADEEGLDGFRYDGDGIGAGVRGDGRVINERRRAAGARTLNVVPYRGSGEVLDPDAQVYETRGGDAPGRTNKDYFHNPKAQNWWGLRRRCYKTHLWVTQGKACDPDEIFSIEPSMPLAQKLVAELSQPTYSQGATGKLLINKSPQGMKSPNLGDAAVIKAARMAPPPMVVTQDMLRQIRGAPRRRG